MMPDDKLKDWALKMGFNWVELPGASSRGPCRNVGSVFNHPKNRVQLPRIRAGRLLA
jgi:hypothetical protein